MTAVASMTRKQLERLARSPACRDLSRVAFAEYVLGMAKKRGARLADASGGVR